MQAIGREPSSGREPSKVALLFLLGVVWVLDPLQGYGQPGQDAAAAAVLRVQKTSDFTVDGKGTAEQWAKANWFALPQRGTSERMSRNPAPVPAERKPPAQLATRAKALYSESGVYFLIECEDRVLQATMKEDFREMWWEDVVEIFLWTGEGAPVYFEYQISPLNYIRMIRQQREGASRLIPYEGGRPVLHRTSVSGGKKESGASVAQWTAEVFIPYEWLQPAPNVPPESGTRWRVNLYRFDYDTGERAKWGWQSVEESNHQLEKFGTLLFE